MESETLQQQLFNRESLYLIFRHKLLISAVLAFSFLFSVIAYYSTPKEYEAVAKILVKLGWEKNADSLVLRNDMYSTPTMTTEDINTEIEIIKSPDLLKEIVTQRGAESYLQPVVVEPRYTPFQSGMAYIGKSIARYFKPNKPRSSELQVQKAIEAIQRKISVEQVFNSDVIAVKYRALTPAEAAETVNRLIELYMDKHIAVHSSKGVLELLSREAGDSRAQLDSIEKKLETFRSGAGVGKEASVPGLSAIGSGTGASENLSGIERKILELEIEKKRLSGVYTAESQPILDINDQISELKSMLQQERGKYASKEKEYGELERQRRTAEERTVLYQKQLDEARIMEAMDQSKIVSVHVISQATPPLTPKSSGLVSRLLLSMVVTLLLCTALILFFYYTDDTFHEEAQVERLLKIPVAASIPMMHRLPGEKRREYKSEESTISSAV